MQKHKKKYKHTNAKDYHQWLVQPCAEQIVQSVMQIHELHKYKCKTQKEIQIHKCERLPPMQWLVQPGAEQIVEPMMHLME